MHRFSAAAAAGHVNRAEWFVRRIAGEFALTVVKCLLAEIARTSLFDNMALHNRDIVFFAYKYALRKVLMLIKYSIVPNKNRNGGKVKDFTVIIRNACLFPVAEMIIIEYVCLIWRKRKPASFITRTPEEYK